MNQVDQEAREQVETLVKQMVEKQGVTEQLKMQDQMKWVGLMNNIKACAEEIVLKEIIYVYNHYGCIKKDAAINFILFVRGIERRI